MTTTIETSFESDGTRCSAWLTYPEGSGPFPAVVLVHGLGATHQMMLAQYERAFSEAGIATLAFDYRTTGASAGSPRQRLAMRRQHADVVAAVEFLKSDPNIDRRRVGLWGTSLGAMHALRVAGERDDLAAVVVQCPIVHGPGAALRSGFAPVLRMTPPIVTDVMRAATGSTRKYIPIVGAPGSTAVVTAPGALEGWNSTAPRCSPFDNRIAAANALGLALISAKRKASKISAPLLICVSSNENLMDVKHVYDVAGAAPKATVRSYDGDHFEIYHPPLVSALLADQTAFLVEALHVGS
ncbi:alpha/beta hydrolase [Mycolicibacterium litorale]|nr:alpha/beta hydrolase [Mycolicibacterium litorale]